MGRPGGRKEISSKCRKTDPEQLLDRDEQCVGAFKAALYAVGELNKTELKEKAQETYEWELVSLLSGTRQVVAGIKYTLKLKVARSTSCHVSDKGPRYVGEKGLKSTSGDCLPLDPSSAQLLKVDVVWQPWAEEQYQLVQSSLVPLEEAKNEGDVEDDEAEEEEDKKEKKHKKWKKSQLKLKKKDTEEEEDDDDEEEDDDAEHWAEVVKHKADAQALIAQTAGNVEDGSVSYWSSDSMISGAGSYAANKSLTGAAACLFALMVGAAAIFLFVKSRRRRMLTRAYSSIPSSGH